MALVKLEKNGYGQLELNFAAFRRYGAIEANCKIDPTRVKNEKGEDTKEYEVPYIENGMLLCVDRARRICGFVGKVEGPIALNYTAEHMYDERTQALKDFKLDNGTFLPRLGYIGVADKFTTNTVCYEQNEFAKFEDIKNALAEGTKLYGKATSIGYIQVTANAEGAVLEVIKATDMPDGQDAIQFAGLQK